MLLLAAHGCRWCCENKAGLVVLGDTSIHMEVNGIAATGHNHLSVAVMPPILDLPCSILVAVEVLAVHKDPAATLS